MRFLFALLLIAARAGAQDLGPPPQFAPVDPLRAELGQLLFYDPILSGNRNISCATCHHPRFGTADGVALGLGEGGHGLGPARRATHTNQPEERIPRNAPGLWNLGAAEFTTMFHDGRLEADPDQPGGIRTPLGQDMVSGFDSVLSAQSMFPVLSGDEMAGQYSENEISRAVRQGLLAQPGGAWDRLAARVAAIPAYAERFAALDGPDQKITFTAISNLLADFIRFEWRADNSLFDQAMRGTADLPEAAARGMALFYGKAGCARCHAGWFQTDHRFHAIAMPQFGPGKRARFEDHARDTGRMRVTGDPGDAFAFRTPSLRNVVLTAPYGHSGAYPTLRGVIRHHADPVAGLQGYDRTKAALLPLDGAEDWHIMDSAEERARIAAANQLPPTQISPAEVDDLIAFLNSLTDNAERLGIPDTVPSGLPVDR
ncbi:cytochrome-c peroxidase [Aliishimia ponticola]|uniref:Cytochrome-c peroxidase n=1 Tax=Aliishimia ponticola TaxID=2499833 RepID=A0A4S4NG71_9RHOB|nr:cytochrome c peroxidase [Aliishimia ponticola]THH38589.1 cytochrome-c peroxidase [Aliishimia ponticola]